MRPIYWKLGAAVTAGIAVGALSGQATIAGMPSPAAAGISSAGLEEPAPGSAYGPNSYSAANPALADYARIAAACENCSDYDLGYRFAASRRLRTTAECMDYSWSYQRGCLAYLRQG